MSAMRKDATGYGRPAGEVGKRRVAERKAGIAPACLRQQTKGRIVAERRKPLRGKPSHLAAAATADVGSRAGPEVAPEQAVEVVGRGLLMPVARKFRGSSLVGRKRQAVHGHQF